MAVAIETTIKVATARQTASLLVNSQIARMQRTVQKTSEIVMMVNAAMRTKRGLTTPRFSRFERGSEIVGGFCSVESGINLFAFGFDICLKLA